MASWCRMWWWTKELSPCFPKHCLLTSMFLFLPASERCPQLHNKLSLCYCRKLYRCWTGREMMIVHYWTHLCTIYSWCVVRCTVSAWKHLVNVFIAQKGNMSRTLFSQCASRFSDCYTSRSHWRKLKIIPASEVFLTTWVCDVKTLSYYNLLNNLCWLVKILLWLL